MDQPPLLAISACVARDRRHACQMLVSSPADELARWLVAENTWGFISTISNGHDSGTVGHPWPNPVSFSDGIANATDPAQKSTGVPYFLMTYLDETPQDIAKDPRGSFSISEGQLYDSICNKVRRCSHFLSRRALPLFEPPCNRLAVAVAMVLSAPVLHFLSRHAVQLPRRCCRDGAVSLGAPLFEPPCNRLAVAVAMVLSVSTRKGSIAGTRYPARPFDLLLNLFFPPFFPFFAVLGRRTTKIRPAPASC